MQSRACNLSKALLRASGLTASWGQAKTGVSRPRRRQALFVTANRQQSARSVGGGMRRSRFAAGGILLLAAAAAALADSNATADYLRWYVAELTGEFRAPHERLWGYDYMLGKLLPAAKGDPSPLWESNWEHVGCRRVGHGRPARSPPPAHRRAARRRSLHARPNAAPAPPRRRWTTGSTTSS
jgi:hypothetical protein